LQQKEASTSVRLSAHAEVSAATKKIDLKKHEPESNNENIQRMKAANG
jgi:hypothetical protein